MESSRRCCWERAPETIVVFVRRYGSHAVELSRLRRRFSAQAKISSDGEFMCGYCAVGWSDRLPLCCGDVPTRDRRFLVTYVVKLPTYRLLARVDVNPPWP